MNNFIVWKELTKVSWKEKVIKEINSIIGMLMESWILPVSCKVSEALLGFMLALQETRSIHDFLNIPKNEFITYIYILNHQSSINFQFLPNLVGFPDILN